MAAVMFEASHLFLTLSLLLLCKKKKAKTPEVAAEKMHQ